MQSDLQSDRSLIERAKQGDPAAWRAIYDSTSDRLLAFLCYQIGDRDEARDILQETYLRAFRSLETYRGDGVAPVAWTSSKRRIRCPAWPRPKGAARGVGSRTSSRRAWCGSSSMKARPLGPWPAS